MQSDIKAGTAPFFLSGLSLNCKSTAWVQSLLGLYLFSSGEFVFQLQQGSIYTIIPSHETKRNLQFL